MVSWSQIIYGRRTVSNFSENSTILRGGPAAENGTLKLSFCRHRTVSGEVKVLIKKCRHYRYVFNCTRQNCRVLLPYQISLKKSSLVLPFCKRLTKFAHQGNLDVLYFVCEFLPFRRRTSRRQHC